MDRHMQHAVFHTIAFLAFSCPAISCLAFSASPSARMFFSSSVLAARRRIADQWLSPNALRLLYARFAWVWLINASAYRPLSACRSIFNKCIAVRKVATPLRELTCHSVACHPAEVTFPPWSFRFNFFCNSRMISGSRRPYAVRRCGSFGTQVVLMVWSVSTLGCGYVCCLSVCIGHKGYELCKNGWSDRHAIWWTDCRGPMLRFSFIFVRSHICRTIRNCRLYSVMLHLPTFAMFKRFMFMWSVLPKYSNCDYIKLGIIIVLTEDNVFLI